MSLFYASINSGSNGNCYYVGTENTGVLIDAGIACRDIERRMQRIKLNLNKVKAIFISHEHTDHVRGINSLAKKYNLPVYLSENTYKKTKHLLDKVTYKFILEELPIIIDDLVVYPFKKEHDAIDPYSFVVEHNNTRVGVMTDLGVVCDNVKKYFETCQAVILEANYCPNMLKLGKYPDYLKNRITSGKGHISNQEALDLFLNHRNKKLSHLMLAHISEENNDSELIYEMFLPKAKGTRISVAFRYSETRLYKLLPKNKSGSFAHHPIAQLRLF